jgi:hypothetical protein
MSDDGTYANIRDIEQLGRFIGCRLVDITQHDEDEWEETHESYIWLHFDNGLSIQFPIGDAGFTVEEPDEDPPETEPPADRT